MGCLNVAVDLPDNWLKLVEVDWMAVKGMVLRWTHPLQWTLFGQRMPCLILGLSDKKRNLAWIGVSSCCLLQLLNFSVGFDGICSPLIDAPYMKDSVSSCRTGGCNEPNVQVVTRKEYLKIYTKFN